ncbi:putative acetyl-CoA carboxylase [Helianthus debilis subsp. tardiflorus]
MDPQFCEQCGVEFVDSRIRRYQMGYIKLAYPVMHVWYLNSSKNEDARTSDPIIRESSTDLDVTQKYRHLWVQCENCYGLNYKKFFKSKMKKKI